MTLNQNCVFIVRGYIYEYGEKIVSEERKTSEDAAELARELLDGGCKAVDIDLIEQGE